MSKITLQDLSHSYLQSQNKDEDWAIRNVNIDWQDGGAYALLGPSGCGKTTLLNIISGLINPTKGKILFNDEDITKKKSSRKKHSSNISVSCDLRYYDSV